MRRGEFDVPLLIQDRRLRDGAIAPYVLADSDVADGFLGERSFVNGAPSPCLEVAAGLYRLRLLNGSKLAALGRLDPAQAANDLGWKDTVLVFPRTRRDLELARPAAIPTSPFAGLRNL